MSDEDLFAQMIGKVTPLAKAEQRVTNNKPQKKLHILRQLEEKDVQQQQNLNPRQTESFLLQADGVSSKDIKKLANMNIKYELDLHGCTQAQAEQALVDFFSHAIAQQIRYLCVVHGKGKHSKNQTSVLKDFTFQWLAHGQFSSTVLIATLSMQSHGGASNILLRKPK